MYLDRTFKITNYNVFWILRIFNKMWQSRQRLQYLSSRDLMLIYKVCNDVLKKIIWEAERVVTLHSLVCSPNVHSDPDLAKPRPIMGNSIHSPLWVAGNWSLDPWAVLPRVCISGKWRVKEPELGIKPRSSYMGNRPLTSILTTRLNSHSNDNNLSNYLN